MRIFPIKNDFPHDFYDEFARFVIAFGRLEYLIKLCIKDLLGQGFVQGMAMAEGTVQFRNLCKKAIEKLNESRERLGLGQDQVDAFSKLIEDAVDVADYRNDTIHAAWTTDSNGQPMRIRPKKGTDGKNPSVERSRVVLVTEIREQRNRSERLYEDLDKARGTWPKAATQI
jgi:hypothetical protein